MKALVTGGLGFVGSHLAEALLGAGWDVRVLDNHSRSGWGHVLTVLGKRCAVAFDDVRCMDEVYRSVEDIDVIFHLAAQVAVTTSVAHPRPDFDTNALGTLNVLEAARRSPKRPPVIYASTNKVYGKLLGTDAFVRRFGVIEEEPLDLRSPYGCSKGAADQYVLDYARTYGLRTAVLRKSCVYGPRQFGCEDQGWLAWFAIAAVTGRPITLYGDGLQARDLLHVRDCVRAYRLAADYLLGGPPGEALALNVGGGPGNVASLLEALAQIAHAAKLDFSGLLAGLRYEPERPGDQRVYVSNVALAEKTLGWRPTTGWLEGTEELVRWVEDNRSMIAEVLRGK